MPIAIGTPVNRLTVEERNALARMYAEIAVAWNGQDFLSDPPSAIQWPQNLMLVLDEYGLVVAWQSDVEQHVYIDSTSGEMVQLSPKRTAKVSGLWDTPKRMLTPQDAVAFEQAVRSVPRHRRYYMVRVKGSNPVAYSQFTLERP